MFAVKLSAALRIKLRQTFHHPLLFVFSEFGKHGQCHNFAGGALGFWQISFGVSEIGEGGLQVERDGVIDFAADFAVSEKAA